MEKLPGNSRKFDFLLWRPRRLLLKLRVPTSSAMLGTAASLCCHAATPDGPTLRLASYCPPYTAANAVAVVEQSSSMRSVKSEVDLRHLVQEDDEVEAVSVEFTS
jgi:hypothetical protein